MCHVCASACRGELPQGGVVSPLKSLVLVIGRAHLEGLLFLLDSRKKGHAGRKWPRARAQKSNSSISQVCAVCGRDGIGRTLYQAKS